MSLGNLSIQYSERIYTALLSLYPAEFRIRFSPEMVQLFRDCSQDALEKGQVAVIVALWIRVVRDLVASAARERSRAILVPINARHPLVAVVDMLLIPGMVAANLLALGPILTLLTLGEAGITADSFFAASAFFSVAIAAGAVVASLVITRMRPTVRLWVKLSA
jgi:hypothetical protein